MGFIVKVSIRKVRFSDKAKGNKRFANKSIHFYQDGCFQLPKNKSGFSDIKTSKKSGRSSLF
jgi:hypothetical protein